MKNNLLLFLMIFNFLIATGQDDLNWNQNLENAKELSKVDKKPVLLYFTGSDWCGACKLLELNYFSKSSFKKIAKKFILVKLDFLKDKSRMKTNRIAKLRELRDFYDIKSFPTTIILGKNEKEIGRIVGYRMKKTKKDYSDFFKQFEK